MSTHTPLRTHRVSHDQLVFDVHDSGPVDGPPVLLLHGFPEDASSWDAVVPHLHAAGLRTLAFDQRGYAPAASPPEVARYRTTALVGDVIGVLDDLGIARVHLVGHDWGGAVAWEAALEHPERLSTLTAVSTPHPAAFARALRTADQLPRSWYMAAFQIPWLPERVLAVAMRRFLTAAGLTDEAARGYARRFRDPSRLRGPVNWYRAASPGRFSRGRGTHEVRVPTTYVWGSHDPALGRGGAEATAGYVRGDYRFVEVDAGHWLPEREPEAVARAIIARVTGAPESSPVST